MKTFYFFGSLTETNYFLKKSQIPSRKRAMTQYLAFFTIVGLCCKYKKNPKSEWYRIHMMEPVYDS